MPLLAHVMSVLTVQPSGNGPRRESDAEVRSTRLRCQDIDSSVNRSTAQGVIFHLAGSEDTVSQAFRPFVRNAYLERGVLRNECTWILGQG